MTGVSRNCDERERDDKKEKNTMGVCSFFPTFLVFFEPPLCMCVCLCVCLSLCGLVWEFVTFCFYLTALFLTACVRAFTHVRSTFLCQCATVTYLQWLFDVAADNNDDI